MKVKITITAQRLLQVDVSRGFFGRKEYIALRGSHADVSVYSGTKLIHSERFVGKLGGLEHTSPYAREAVVELPDDLSGPLTVFATCPGIFTYRFDMEPVQ